ncbi:hypothetical protein E1B28_009483 [Marasmius oreades]|uniref:Uncharacterized protein n=1 Tax=Marasmius oreades TaxID=181124 RepID=A0A9P7UQH9_9AGAR|nr:uncharacterized protein E1B28_009483 [Marasmius oreades]KAG7090363.1 hypothetical protein E1B28_009483 [Marasmius oreades]
MQIETRQKEEQEGVEFWSFVLHSVRELDLAGISDDEDSEIEGQKVKLVHQLDFRHPDFRPLFEMVDHTTPEKLSRRGRQRPRGVLSPLVTEREPPSGIAPERFKPEYLAAMRAGQKPQIRLGHRDYPVAHFESFMNRKRQEGLASGNELGISVIPAGHHTIIHTEPAPVFRSFLTHTLSLAVTLLALFYHKSFPQIFSAFLAFITLFLLYLLWYRYQYNYR